MVPQIWSALNIIFCHFRMFLALLPPYGPRKLKFSKKQRKQLKILSFYKHKQQSYDLWFLRYGVQRTEFFVILECFLLFYPSSPPPTFYPSSPPPTHPPDNQKNENFEKMRKLPGDIIISHSCNIYDNYDVWFLRPKHDRQKFLSFWNNFCPFIPLTT